MHAKPATYYPGIEFYRRPDMGLTGIANAEDGSSSTYSYLSDEEAAAWLAAWLKGAKWVRSHNA